MHVIIIQKTTGCTSFSERSIRVAIVYLQVSKACCTLDFAEQHLDVVAVTLACSKQKHYWQTILAGTICL